MQEESKLIVNRISDDKTHIIFPDGKELHLIGTAHVSAESVKVVEETINDVNPDTIAVELDEQRLEVIKNKKKYENTDIIEIIKKKKTIFFVAQLMMSSYQKRMAEKLGVKPGAEFRKAVDLAEKDDKKLILADRNISITLKRLMRKMSFWTKLKVLASLFAADDKDNDIDEKSIAELKEKDNLMALIGEMGEELPIVKTVLLDERNQYLAEKIKSGMEKVNVAVVGAAHAPGIVEYFKNEEKKNLEELDVIPPASTVGKIIPWVLPIIIIGLFIYGFFTGQMEQTGEAAIYWILINGILTAIGCMIALGHPLTILAGFIAAPITSLNPTIGAGIVAGLVQIYLVKPKVLDFETVSEDSAHFKGWWKNKLMRALLVTILASLGSSIGSFVAFPIIVKLLT